LRKYVLCTNSNEVCEKKLLFEKVCTNNKQGLRKKIVLFEKVCTVHRLGKVRSIIIIVDSFRLKAFLESLGILVGDLVQSPDSMILITPISLN
jgi:hypothetical protein